MTIIKFPCEASRRVHLRRSKNGTPEESRLLSPSERGERVSAGLARAREKGVTLGRPRIVAAADPAFALIAAKLAADIAYGEAIDAQDEADESGIGKYEADDCCLAACDAAAEIEWKLANTPPTTLEGVAAVLRFANEIEDANLEWPNTDTIGPDGWHYQLRATMAAAIEALIKGPAGKAVQS
jgi:hypothetical protein